MVNIQDFMIEQAEQTVYSIYDYMERIRSITMKLVADNGGKYTLGISGDGLIILDRIEHHWGAGVRIFELDVKHIHHGIPYGTVNAIL